MHAADFGFVIIDQPDALGRVRRVDGDLFLQFPPHSLLIRIADGVPTGVDGRNMAADAHAALAVQPAFAHAGAASVLEDGRPAVAACVAKNHVRNQLLEAGVLFHLIRGR